MNEKQEYLLKHGLDHLKAASDANLSKDAQLVLCYIYAKEMENCLRWLLHLAHGVSKGGGTPTADEWEAAWNEAHRLLDAQPPAPAPSDE